MKKSILFTTFLALFLALSVAGTAHAQITEEVANIGNDNQTTVRGPNYSGTNVNLGLFGDDTYQFETIYLEGEINLTAEGQLKAIEFYISGGLSLGLLQDIQLYLKTSDENDPNLSDGNISNPEGEGYELIEGSFSLLNLGLSDGDIARFVLDDGFEIAPGENLYIHTRSSDLANVSLGGDFYATSTGSDNLTKASTPVLLGLGGFSSMSVTDLRPNVRLEFESEFELSASNSVITAQRPQILADGSSTTLVTLQARTTTGENVNSGGENVQFSTSSGSIGSANDNGDGTYTAVLTSADSPGTATITATVNGSSVGDSAEVEFVDSLADLFCTDLENEQIQIGTVTSSTTARGPLFNNTLALTLGTYQFESIFLQNELDIDGPGFLNAIEFLVTDDINVDLLGNAQFFVKETSQTSLSDGNVDLDGYTFVGGNSALLSVTISGQQRLRLEFETPLFYSGNGNIAIHSRQNILADVDLGGEFHFESANSSLTKVSQDLIGLLGITVGLTAPETTSQRPIVNFDFDLMTTASLSESSLAADPDRIPADGTSTSLITTLIRTGSGAVCVLESGNPDFNTTAGTLGSITHEGDGEYTSLLTSSNTPEIALVTVDIDGSILDQEEEVEFFADVLPPSPDFTTIEADPTQILADGSSTSEITVTLRDANDDPVTSGGFDVQLSTTAGTLGSITDNGDGTYTATLTSSTEEETAEITGTLEGDDIQDTAEVVFVDDTGPPTPSPDFTTIEADPTQILADGSSTSEITVTLRDANDDPVTSGGFDVQLSTTAGTLGSITDNGDGTYTATLTSSTEEETAEITGTLEGDDIQDTAEVNFVVELDPKPDPDNITIEIDADPAELPADGESQANVIVTLFDEDGERITQGGFCSDIDLSTTLGTLGDITDNGDGTCTAVITAPTEPGTAVITGTFEGDDINDSAELVFTPLEPSAENTTIRARPDRILADGQSTSSVQVILRDENNNRVNTGGYSVELFTTAGTLSDVTDEGDGIYSATLTSSTAEETAVITGTLEGEDIEDSAEVRFVLEFLPPSAEFTTIEADPTQIMADGESTSVITVQLRDENDETVGMGGFDVDLVTTTGTLSDVTDNDDGTYTAILTSSIMVETATITGTLEGEEIDDFANVNFVLDDEEEGDEPDLSRIIIEADPVQIPADGVSTSKITVTLYNEDGDRITEGGFCSDIELFTTLSTISDLVDNGDGTCEAVLEGNEQPGTAVITGRYMGDDIDDQAEVEFLSLDNFSCKVDMNYPNPFMNQTTFRVSSPAAGRVTLELYDILGKRVAVAEQDVTAGDGHEFVFDGSGLSGGVYIYKYTCPCRCKSDTGTITHIGRN